MAVVALAALPAPEELVEAVAVALLRMPLMPEALAERAAPAERAAREEAAVAAPGRASCGPTAR